VNNALWRKCYEWKVWLGITLWATIISGGLYLTGTCPIELNPNVECCNNPFIQNLNCLMFIHHHVDNDHNIIVNSFDIFLRNLFTLLRSLSLYIEYITCLYFLNFSILLTTFSYILISFYVDIVFFSNMETCIKIPNPLLQR